VAGASNQRRAIRFGVFELELEAGELRKGGIRVKLQEQPFQVLELLLEHPGEIVTREEIVRQLWPDGTFVEFDRSLNIAVNKIREALGDSAENPRFLETVPRRGYRFLADVHRSPAPVPPNPPGPEIHQTAKSPRRRLLAAVIALSALLAAAVYVVVNLGRHQSQTQDRVPLRRFAIPAETGISQPVISPNGRLIVYVSDRQIRIHDLKAGETRLIEGTNGARGPFWTPDSGSVAYSVADEFRQFSLAGGRSVRLFGKPATNIAGATFSPSRDSIVFSSFHTGGWKLSEFVFGRDKPSLLSEALGWGSATRLTSPQFVPLENGRKVLLFVAGPTLEGRIYARDLDTNETTLIGTGSNPTYSPSGHIVYQASGTSVGLRAVRFSTEKMQVVGEPFSITERGVSPSVARDGTLAYLDAGPPLSKILVWWSRSGERLGTIGQQQQGFGGIALSPSENRVAAAGLDRDNYDIWIHEVERPVKTRLTYHPDQDVVPHWSPSGDQIIYTSFCQDPSAAFIVPADGSRKPELLVDSAWADSWSADGKTLVFARDFTLWSAELTDGRVASEPVQVLPFWARDSRLSPDGRSVAYAAKELGQWDVYVCKFPGGEGRVRVSSDGGLYPRWRRDGKELYYVEGPDYSESRDLVAVPVTTTPTFQITGPPQKLFTLPTGTTPAPSADGQRFVVAEPVGEKRAPVIRLVMNWYEEFRGPEAQDRP
jgi:DNA-binding winged helix-turn-helix (wHTH) protein/Tol biopolymer transport system component